MDIRESTKSQTTKRSKDGNDDVSLTGPYTTMEEIKAYWEKSWITGNIIYGTPQLAYEHLLSLRTNDRRAVKAIFFTSYAMHFRYTRWLSFLSCLDRIILVETVSIVMPNWSSFRRSIMRFFDWNTVRQLLTSVRKGVIHKLELRSETPGIPFSETALEVVDILLTSTQNTGMHQTSDGLSHDLEMTVRNGKIDVIRKPQPSRREKPHSLLGLPREIRDMILRNVIISGGLDINFTGHPPKASLSIFQVNSQLYTEATQLFYGKSAFIFRHDFRRATQWLAARPRSSLQHVRYIAVRLACDDRHTSQEQLEDLIAFLRKHMNPERIAIEILANRTRFLKVAQWPHEVRMVDEYPQSIAIFKRRLQEGSWYVSPTRRPHCVTSYSSFLIIPHDD